MKIQAIKNDYTPQFKANSKWIYGANDVPLFKTTTAALRNDLNWREYIYKICGKYKDVKNVNVTIHACSNGLEALSFLAALMYLKPKETDKFCPIIAKDICDDNIKQAQSGRYEVTLNDLARISNFTSGQANKFFDTRIRGEKFYIEPKQELRDRIIFEQGNVFEDINDLPNRNSILHCRNIFPYLSASNRETLLCGIAEKFIDDSSILVLGDYDFDGFTENMLDYYGFAEDLYVKNVYSKKGDYGRFSSILY